MRHGTDFEADLWPETNYFLGDLGHKIICFCIFL